MKTFYLHAVTAVLVIALFSSCQSTPQASVEKSTALTPHFSIQQVKEIAAAKARANGFHATADDPWTLSLQISPKGYTWTTNVQRPNRIEPYWIHVDDRTGLADFVFPQLSAVEPPKGSEWLLEVASALPKIKYPLPLEAFAKEANVPNLQTSSGGSDASGRVYFEYTLRNESDSPARFELRFYCDLPQGFLGPKIVTKAEIYYVDAKINYYLLGLPNQ